MLRETDKESRCLAEKMEIIDEETDEENMYNVQPGILARETNIEND